jgi:hypothetical protein
LHLKLEPKLLDADHPKMGVNFACRSTWALDKVRRIRADV